MHSSLARLGIYVDSCLLTVHRALHSWVFCPHILDPVALTALPPLLGAERPPASRLGLSRRASMPVETILVGLRDRGSELLRGGWCAKRL